VLLRSCREYIRGLPPCFEGVELATDIMGSLRRGAAVATPLRGFYLLAK
jgi:hypothetical protein